MTTTDFSNGLDILLNSWEFQLQQGYAYSPVVLDEYEKSVFLTLAQKEIIIELYKGKFDEAARHVLSPIIKDTELKPVGETGMFEDSYMFRLPDDLWFILLEKALISDDSLACSGSSDRTVEVYPVTPDKAYHTVMSPFRGSNERRVLRLDRESRLAELVSRYPVSSYTVRYLCSPHPIITEVLPEELGIDGEFTPRTCELGEAVHKDILTRAAANALKSKTMLVRQNNNQ